MTKKQFLLIILAILLLIAAVLVVLFFTIFKKTLTISDCQDIACIENYIGAENFIPDDCAKAPENLRDDCYYTYELGNLELKKTNPGKYCHFIKDENLGVGCVYETIGAIIITTNNIEPKIRDAMESLDANKCDKISVNNLNLEEELKKICIDGVALVGKAIEEKDLSLCVLGCLKNKGPYKIMDICILACNQVARSQIKL